MWTGSYSFLLRSLILKDFRIRYRHMSLGIFWSLLNPIVMMGVLTFIFVRVFTSPIPHYAVFVLCGIVPFNFFVTAWGGGTNSLVDYTAMIKRVPVPREIIPIASVLSNCPHFLIQIGLLLALAVAFGIGVNIHWLWLPVIWAVEIMFVCGLTLITSSLNVYSRDVRYVVESLNTIMFWFVPIVYSFTLVPQKYSEIFLSNPLTAQVIMLRSILLDGHEPSLPLMMRFVLVSGGVLAIGMFVFHKLQTRFYDHL
jgi:lipopolysaccharide transport system permease protein